MIEIPLSRGYVAVLDDEDAALVARHRWFAAVRTNTVYAVANVTTNGKRSSLLLHRLVTSAPAGKDVDHIDGDGLNNRRANLRVCEHAENGRNQRSRRGASRFKGVYFATQRGKWQAQISLPRRTNLGYFAREEDAARAYDRAAREHFGAFAALNFPQERTGQ